MASRIIGISRSQLCRAKLLDIDKGFSLGKDFIAKVLAAFQNRTFDYFSWDKVSNSEKPKEATEADQPEKKEKKLKGVHNDTHTQMHRAPKSGSLREKIGAAP
ncbi:hypothetical protein AC624_04540 [Bacillus sp. FJAT-27238]|nr:hypothetical protein AC624_04540 [Bacillus sp. FJAT-27238]